MCVRSIFEECDSCGGYGGFSVESTFDPFSGRIGYRDYECVTCGGEGGWAIELERIDEEDLPMMSGDDVVTPQSDIGPNDEPDPFAPVTEAYLRTQYAYVRRLPSGVWIGVRQMAYTTGLFVGLDRWGYSYRYCYESSAEAGRDALTWDGNADPPGLWIKQKGYGEDRMNPRWLAEARDELKREYA